MDEIEKRIVFEKQSLSHIVSDLFQFQWLKGEKLSDKNLGRRILRSSFSKSGNIHELD